MTKKTPELLPNLETSLTEITALIEKMEHGDLTLEQSLNQFERGITLVKHCQKMLSEAEQKVKILMQHNQQETLEDYHADKTNPSKSTDDHAGDESY